MERTWLDALPSHAVFSTPSPSLLSHGEPLPPSPGLSTVASFHGDDSLANHSSTQHGMGNAAASTSSLRRRHQATCVIRKTELLVAVGTRIRLADLAHFKSRAEAAEAWRDGDDESSVLNGTAADLTGADYAGSSDLGSFKVRLNQDVEEYGVTDNIYCI